MADGELIYFPWNPQVSEMAEALHVDEEDMPAFAETFALAVATFAPRVYMREVAIEALGDDFAMLSGEWFEGERIASVLSGAKRAWAIVATAGEKPDCDPNDALRGWWLQALGEHAVHHAISACIAKMPCPDGEHLSTISPGSLPDWPITQQVPLFRLLGDQNAGVRLTDTCLMLPRCSVSGVVFSATRAFCSCAHCHRHNCPNRRAEECNE